MVQKIMVVEDEPAIADTVVYALKTENYLTAWFATGQEALAELAKTRYALIIIDIGLPDMSGFDLCRKIRGQGQVPVIFLTARGDEVDRIVGLEIGADDYMVKPFSPRELTARVRAVLRRSVPPSEPSRPSPQLADSGAPFTVDRESMRISYFGSPLQLSKCEFRVLDLLVQHPKRVFSREELMNNAWDEPGFALERTIDAHIKSIRNKLRAIRPDTDPIETRRGFGYALKES